MATTTRRKKTTLPAVDDMPQTFETIAISDVCTQNGLSEQTFRLALMEFQPDDFDSVRAIPVTVAEGVLATIQATSKALPETTQNPENITPQKLQPSQETATQEPQKPLNSPMVASTPKAISSPATAATVPTALTEFIAKAQDDIELFDLVQVYRNEQILTNSESRDSELVLKLREQRLESRALVFDQLRDLNSRQPVPQELPELPSSLSEEIKALSDELGKQLNRAA
jgi:hypothetical protein